MLIIFSCCHVFCPDTQLLLTLVVACDCLIQNNLQIFLYLCTVKQTNICTLIDYQQKPITTFIIQLYYKLNMIFFLREAGI